MRILLWKIHIYHDAETSLPSGDAKAAVDDAVLDVVAPANAAALEAASDVVHPANAAALEVAAEAAVEAAVEAAENAPWRH